MLGFSNIQMIMLSLITLGTIGAFDEIFFHQIQGRILYRKDCLNENVLHLIRSFCFSIIFCSFGLFDLQGGFIFILIVPFIVDLVVGVLDILIESKSREFQGGLSPLEYLTHMVLSFHLMI